MTLLQKHIVGKALLDVRVEEETSAIAWQSTLNRELAESIQQVMGEVFDRFSSPDSIHRFDSIDLDLGVISINACKQELPERLRQKLTAYLSERIFLHNSAATADSGRSSDFNQLQHYLHHGYLPYNGDYRSDQSVRLLWERITSVQPGALVDFIIQANAGGIMEERLRTQFPPHAVDPILDEVRWKRTGLPLDAYTLRTELLKAMRLGAPYTVAAHWNVILRHRPQLVLDCLRLHCGEAAVLRRIAHTFPEHMILDMITLLEPTESGFLQSVLKHPEVFDAARRDTTGHEATSRKQPRHQLYEFTLTYLLVERGSRFNRKEYLRSILSRMAAHDNISFHEVITTITKKYQVEPQRTRMHADVLKLLSELQEDALPVSAADALPGSPLEKYAPQQDQLEFSQRLARALSAGDLADIGAMWSALLSKHPTVLKQTLANYGQIAAVRHMMARSFSEAMLQDTIQLLEPYNARFIISTISHTTYITHARTNTSADNVEHRRPLYEFTLTYLLVERGSRFNRKEYMRSILHCMAAHENRSCDVLIKTITEAFQAEPPAGRMHNDILSLLFELYQERYISTEEKPHSDSQSFNTEPIPASMRLLQLLSHALMNRNIHGIEATWTTLLETSSVDLRQMLVDHGQTATVRRYISRTFSEAMLHDVIRLLEPYDAPFILAVIDHHDRFSRALGHEPGKDSSLQHTLYEFTLAFLMVERGGTFNKTMYLESLIHRLASHENMRYAELLHSLTLIFESLPHTRESQSHLQRILTELAHNAPVKQHPRPYNSDSGSPLFSIYESYDRLRGTLLPGMTSTLPIFQSMRDADITGFLKNLKNGYPELIFLLFGELQAGFAIFTTTLPGLSVSVLEQLIASFIAAGLAGPTYSKEAITQIVYQSDNREKTLQAILVSLIQRRPVVAWKLYATDTSKQTCTQPTSKASPARETPQSSLNLSNELEDMLHKPVSELHRWLEYNITRHGLRWLCDQLGDRTLASLVQRLASSSVSVVLQYADVMTAAIIEMQPKLHFITPRHMKWQFILMYLFEQGRRFLPRKFVIEFAAYIAGVVDFAVPAEFNRRLIDAVSRITSISKTSTGSEIKSILDQNNVPETATAKRLPEAFPSPRGKGPGKDAYDDASTYEEEVFIANAGLVLTAPFLPRLFSMLNMLDNNAFKDWNTAERAVHLLQYVANTSTDSPEYQLVLNKLMCGVKNREPICCGISISAEEIQATESMLAGMLSHWKILGNTSTTGLRESFLQRDGCLQLQDNAWNLQVEKKAYDMLLDQVPWSFSTIKFPWMERVIHVHWN